MKYEKEYKIYAKGGNVPFPLSYEKWLESQLEDKECQDCEDGIIDGQVENRKSICDCPKGDFQKLLNENIYLKAQLEDSKEHLLLVERLLLL